MQLFTRTLPFILFTLVVLLSFSSVSQNLTVDAAFNPTDNGDGLGDGANGSIYSHVILPNGQVIIVGAFTAYNGSPAKYIARLNADGTLDQSFNAGGIGPLSSINEIIALADGKFLIGGPFISYNDLPSGNLARLNSDGTLDQTFSNAAANGEVMKMAVQSDGKMIVVGKFTSFSGETVNRIVRINIDGTRDATFDTGLGANAEVSGLAIQPDGKVVIVGLFTSFNGTSLNRIARLNNDGTLDAGFTPGTGANLGVQSVIILASNKILIGGSHLLYNGTSTNTITRLNANGTLDGTFTAAITNMDLVHTLVEDGDGKILVGGGEFGDYDKSIDLKILRLNTNGSADASFDVGSGASNTVYSMGFQTDGKILAFGAFKIYRGKVLNSAMRVNTNGTVDSSFNPGTQGASGAVTVIASQSDGKILVGGQFGGYNDLATGSLVRVNEDGTIDGSFNAGGAGPLGAVQDIKILQNGKIFIAGDFIRYNGTITRHLARLHSDGTLDATFSSQNMPNSVYAIAIQNDGKILIGGAFLTYTGISRKGIARLHEDGSLDTSFDPGTAFANSTVVYDLCLQPDGKILVGGAFTTFNEESSRSIVRLNADGSRDHSFTVGTGTNGSVRDIELQSDGKILLGGKFTNYNGNSRNSIVRINTDGSIDATFAVGSAIGTTIASSIESVKIINDKIVVGGSFSSFNGTSRRNIVWLNFNGSVDTSFNPGVGANGILHDIHSLSDGTMLLGGNFFSFNGTGKTRLAKIYRLLDQTITNFTSLPSKTYGDAAFTLGASATSGLSVFYTSSNPAVATVAGNTVTVLAAGETTITASQAGDLVYQAAPSIALSLTVAKVALTLTGLGAAGKEYDGTTTAVVTGSGTLNGVLNSEDVTVAEGTAAFENKNAGVNKVVIFSGYNLQGTAMANYSLQQPASVPANITAKAVTYVGVSVEDKNYDGTTQSTPVGGTLNGIIAGDDVQIVMGNATFADKNANTGIAVTFSDFALEGNDATNYTLEQPSASTGSILVRTLIVSADDEQEKIYGASDPVLTYTSTPALFGADEFTGALARETGETAGTYSILAGTLSAGSNYSIELTEAVFSIHPKALTLTGVIANNKVYDGMADAAVSSGTPDGIINNDDVTIQQGSAAFSTSHAGENIDILFFGYSLIGADAGNYTFDPPLVQATITPKPITVTPTASQTKIYGDVDPSLAYSVEPGLISGDTFTGALGRESGETVGDYAINQGTLSPGNNYLVTFTGEDFSIHARTLTLTGILAADKSYDGTTTAEIEGGTLNGVLVGDEVSFSPGSGVFDNVSVGVDKTITLTGFTLTGADANNYMLTPPSPINADVLAMSITVTADSEQRKMYGDSDPDFTFTVDTPLITGDSFIGSIAREGGEGVGSYPLTVGTLTAGSNYSITFVFSNFVISPKTLSLSSIVAEDKEYDATTVAQLTIGSLEGALSGDLVSLQPVVATFADKNVGSGKPVIVEELILTGSEAANYILEQPGALVASILPKAITITANDKQKSYGTADPLLDYSVEPSLFAGDNVEGTILRVAGETAGTYAIQQGSLSVSSNYDLTFVAGSLVIDPISITIAVDANQGKVFGETDPVLTYTSSPSLLQGDELTGQLSRASSENAGVYPINLGSLTAGNNYSLTLVQRDFTISKASQLISFTLGFSERISTAEDIALVASSTSGLTVTFTAEGPATIEGANSLHLTGQTGSVTIVANQSGDENHHPAASVSQTFTVIPDPTTGIEDKAKITVNVFPNPATSMVTIETEGEPIHALHLYDMHGKLLKVVGAQKSARCQVDVSDIVKGSILLLQIETSKGKTIKKLTIH